jgi:methylamine dehydrogenase accessory protein MauD
MGDALIVSNAALWVVVLVLGAAVLALMRQVGVLHERIAPAGALVGGESPRVGEAAPVLEVEDWNGSHVRLGGEDPSGRGTLLFFVAPNCPVCKTLLPVLPSVMAAEDAAIRLILASDGERTEHEAFVAAHQLAVGTYVLSTPLGMAYQVGRLPYAVLLDGAGVVRARGLVNTREHLESLFHAQELGVASVQEFAERGGRRVA